MQDSTGIHEQKKIPIVPIAPGEAHLQNEITNYNCYICGLRECEDTDMALLHINGKTMRFACLNHAGVIQEFMRQYYRVPLGWTKE